MDQMPYQTHQTGRVSNHNTSPEGMHAFTKQLLHDLRSPLGVIMLSSSWISDQSKQETIIPIREANAMIIEQALYIRDLIDKADRIFDLQAQKSELKLTRIDLVDFTRQIVQEFNTAKNREIQLAEPLKKHVITTDPIRYREALQYLFEFFLTFSHGPTPIQIQISDHYQHEIIIKITDPCMDVPPDQLDSLFIPFNRAQVSAAATNQGSGLGTYLAKILINDYLKGKLSVDSKPGAGTGFEIILPAVYLRGRRD
jgi:K+-sensing histidine kinase KdpD